MRNKTAAFVGQALKNLFSKPATRQVAERGDYWAAGNRGHIEIEADKCILCGMCSRRCPSAAIEVDRKGGSWSINRFNCVQCGICTEVCPKKCLFMSETFPPGGVDRLVRDAHHVEPPAPPKRPAAKPAAGAKPAAAANAAAKSAAVTKPAAGAKPTSPSATAESGSTGGAAAPTQPADQTAVKAASGGIQPDRIKPELESEAGAGSEG